MTVAPSKNWPGRPVVAGAAAAAGGVNVDLGKIVSVDDLSTISVTVSQTVSVTHSTTVARLWC